MNKPGNHSADPSGLHTLELLAKADKFNSWMYQTIRPFCKDRVFEVGSGIGNISQYLLADGFSLTASDLRTDYCQKLKRRFETNPKLQDVRSVDLVHPTFDSTYADLLEKFDTVIALNVIEHIELDELAVMNCRKLLKQDGHLIILVPAHQSLYNTLDSELGHFRRYTVEGMSTIIRNTGMKVIRTQYFNAMGTMGWFVNGNLLKKRLIPGNQLSIYNKLVPFFKLIDAILFRKFGLSAICVGKK